MAKDKNLSCTECPAFSICPEKPVREDYTNETEYLIDLESGVWNCRKTIEKLWNERQKLIGKDEVQINNIVLPNFHQMLVDEQREQFRKLEKENEELRTKWLQATDEGTSWARLKNLENTNEKLRQEKEQCLELLKKWENSVCVGLSEGCCPSCKECLFGELKEKTDNILREVVK